jgi:hypothetical protein
VQPARYTEHGEEALLFRRILRAARFDPKLYLEIADDPSAFVQAASIMFLSALAFGLGIKGGFYPEETYSAILVWSFLYHIAGWVLLGGLTYLAKRLRSKETIPVLATFNGVGFAHVPGVLYLFLSFGSEFLALFTNVIVTLAMVVGLAMAFRQTSKVSRSVAFLMAVIGVILMIQVRQDLLVRIVL